MFNSSRRPHRPLLPVAVATALITGMIGGVVGPSDLRAAVGAAPAHVFGTGSIGSGATTQTVSLDATTGAEVFGTFSITTGDPGTAPTPVNGTVVCVANWSGVVTVGVVLSGGTPLLVGISDGTPSAQADTMTILVDSISGSDCTYSFSLGTPLASGDFTVGAPPCSPSAAPGSDLTDLNGDLIADVLQPGSAPAGSFCDGSTQKATYGSIVDTGGLSLFVSDAPFPAGVLVTVDAGTPGAQATFLTCGGYTITVGAGSSATITCASVKLAVSTGTAQVVLSGGHTTVSVTAGASAEVARTSDGSYVVTNSGTIPITLTIDGSVTVIGPGASTTLVWSFIGFSAPVERAPALNVAQAGQAVSLRWRLLDGLGVPVTTLASATVTATNLSCGFGTTVDLTTEAAPDGTGLKNLGDGNYQFVWKSPKAYAGSCKTLRLDIGDGASHEALFQFAR